MGKPLFLSDELLEWFSSNQRALPWRNAYDPYLVWLSEVMLQQTRVEQALPYFERFVKQFPSIQVLAKAREQEVLKAWEGLGYYSRARNLHKAAQIIESQFRGKIPSDYLELLKLPGFGPYISAAVSSIAFNQDQAVVDGNVFRVLSRFFGITDDIRAPASRKKFQQIADEILPLGNARFFNQSLMELGALVCTPEVPSCGQCPLSRSCFAFVHSCQSEFPVSSKKPARPVRVFAALRVKNRVGFWLLKNKARLLNGLYSFPLVAFDPLNDSKKEIAQKVLDSFGVSVSVLREIGRVSHDYTHFRQIAVLFDAKLKEKKDLQSDSVSFFSNKKLNQLPLTKLQHKLLAL